MCTKVTSEMHISHGVVCYKIVKLPWDATNKDKLLHKIKRQKNYVTCFQDSDISIGRQYSGYPCLTKQQAESVGIIGHSLGSGFIHSFKIKEDAIKFSKDICFKNVAVIECIIPDETPYFEGIWSDFHYLSYASTNIKYVKRVY
jgi:hypothetical protein